MTQRVSRGFHRLAVFLAAIPAVLGTCFAIFGALGTANEAESDHDQRGRLVCAQDAIHKKYYADLSRDELDRRVAAKLADAAETDDSPVRELLLDESKIKLLLEAERRGILPPDKAALLACLVG